MRRAGRRRPTPPPRPRLAAGTGAGRGAGDDQLSTAGEPGAASPSASADQAMSRALISARSEASIGALLSTPDSGPAPPRLARTTGCQRAQGRRPGAAATNRRRAPTPRRDHPPWGPLLPFPPWRRRRCGSGCSAAATSAERWCGCWSRTPAGSRRGPACTWNWPRLRSEACLGNGTRPCRTGS